MEKGTKVVAHEGMGTGIFSKCGHGDGHCSTLPIGYPLPSLGTHEGTGWVRGGHGYHIYPTGRGRVSYYPYLWVPIDILKLVMKKIKFFTNALVAKLVKKLERDFIFSLTNFCFFSEVPKPNQTFCYQKKLYSLTFFIPATKSIVYLFAVQIKSFL